jgi:hypothetical protein
VTSTSERDGTKAVAPVKVPGGGDPMADDAVELARLIDALVRRSQPGRDDERVATLRAHGFTGVGYDALRDEHWLYAYPVLLDAIRTGTIVARCRGVGSPVVISPDDRLALHTDRDERVALAVDSLLDAERYFRTAALGRGKWDGSRGVALKTFFVGCCFVKFPDAYQRWSRRRSDRLVTTYYGTDAEGLAGAVAAHAVDPEMAAVQRDLVARLFEMARPTGRAVLALMAQDLTYAEIGRRLGLSERAVEGQVYRLRRQAHLLAGRVAATGPVRRAS